MLAPRFNNDSFCCMPPSTSITPLSQPSPNSVNATAPLVNVGRNVLPSRLSVNKNSAARTISPNARAGSGG